MQIQINEEKKELKQHGDYTFPVHLSGEMLSRYEGGSFFWHWHTEVELTLILKGQIEYRVNERTYHLKAGEGLFCNSNAMHAGKRIDNQDCQYFSVTFHPRFLYGFESSILQTKYVDPILNTSSFSSAALLRAALRKIVITTEERAAAGGPSLCVSAWPPEKLWKMTNNSRVDR